MALNDDELLFIDDEIKEDMPQIQNNQNIKDQNYFQEDNKEPKTPWKVLIVDDDEEIHFITKLALKDFVFDGRKLEFISAFSGEEAKKIIKEHKDIALVLLDVVMEDDNAGLKVVKYIRDVEKNQIIRIILRTGQPGQAPESKVIIEYDINDYKTKTELTAQKLVSIIVTALRSYRDIISKIKAQDMLSHKTKELQEERDIFISGPVSIFKLQNKENLPVEYASNNVKELFGYSVDEFLDKKITLTKLIFPEDYERLKNELKIYNDPNISTSEHEYRIRTKDNRVLWLNHFFKAIRDENSNVTHFYGYVIDVTKKKELELLFFENAAEGILLLDQNRFIKSANRAICEILKLKKENIINRSIYEFLDDDNKEILKHIDALFDSKSSVNRFEISLKQAGENRVPCLLNPTLIRDLSGKTIGLLAFVVDLSEQKKMQEDLERAMKAEKRFIATMSHEIRTPLTSILGFIEILKDTHLLENQRELVQNISISSQHLLSLINSILDVSKVEAGQLELTQDEMNLDEVLNECGIIISNRVKPNVKLIIEVPELDFYVFGDQVRIKQIFVNLLGNAAKFTEKGHIRLFISKLKELDDKQVFIEVCVEDTGIGISEEKQHYLFQPFKQAHGSKFGGTGLGLYLSKSFARLMQGDIRLESKVGEGTRFYVSMVLKKGGLKEMQFDLTGKSILYIEDDKFLVHQFKEKFKKAGAISIFIDTNRTILDIIQIAQGIKPDIVVLNMNALKDRSGYIASALKEIFPKLKIIATKSESNIAEYKEIDGYLNSPFTFYKLISLIAEQLKDQTYRSKEFENLKVLVAEDVEINQELVKRLFKKFFNIDVDIAANGIEAVNMVKSNKYDVVFMDMNMPYLDGTDATEQIRKFNPTIPIIALTANAYAEDIQKAYKSGMNGYMTKPFEKEKIQKALFNALGIENEKSDPIKNGTQTIVQKNNKNLKEQAKATLLLSFDEKDVEMLLEQTSKQTKKILEEIDKAILNNNIQNLTRLYHSLKGMLLSINLKKEAELAKDLELACRSGEKIEMLKQKSKELKDALFSLIN